MLGYFERKKTENRIKEEQLVIERKNEIADLAEIMVKDRLLQIEEDKKAEIKKKEDDDIEEKRLAQIAVDLRRKKMMDSDEPYFELTSHGVTDKGLRMEFDWNKAWIKYLNKHGFKGVDDEATVYKYLAALERERQLEEIATNYSGLADTDEVIEGEIDGKN